LDSLQFIELPNPKLSLYASIKKFLGPTLGEEAMKDRLNSEHDERASKVLVALSAHKNIWCEKTSEVCLEKFKQWAEMKGDLNCEKIMFELVDEANITVLMGGDTSEDSNSVPLTASDIKRFSSLYSELEDNGLRATAFLAPWLPYGPAKRNEIIRNELMKIISPIVESRRQYESKVDYLDEYVKVPKKNKEDWTDVEILERIISTLVAARINSALTLTWTILHIADDPKLCASVRAMLKNRKSEELDTATIKSFTLLDNCIKETIRMIIARDGIPRAVVEDLEYKGYLIPTGHFLWGNQLTVHYDDNIFEKSDQYIPTRWETLKKELFTGFGSGHHRCKGEQFAMNQIKTIVANLFDKYEVYLPEGLPRKYYPSQQPAKPFGGGRIRIVPR